MYPTITDLLRDLLGINLPLPLQTFGFFVMMAFAAGAYTLWLELSRKHKEGLMPGIRKTIMPHRGHTLNAYILPAISGFVIGYKLLEAFMHYQDLVEDPQGFILSSRGNLLGGILSMLFTLFIEYKEINSKLTKKASPIEVIMQPRDHLGNIIMIALVSGLLGAKIFHNLENPAEFMMNPVEAIFSFSGLTFYGGLIVATLSLWVYSVKNHLYFPYLMDASAPALMLAYGIGRMGCQLSGDGDWGIVNTAPKPGWMSFLPDWCWAFQYPRNVIGDGVPIPGCTGPHCMQLEFPVFPTPLYESIAGMLLFVVLWTTRKKIKNTLVLFCFYLLLNGSERFLIERIRVNSVYEVLGGVTQAQIISFIFILAGASGMLYFQKKPMKAPVVIQ